MIEFLVTLIVSLLLGAGAGIWYAHRQKSAAPGLPAPRHSEGMLPGAPAPGTFRLISTQERLLSPGEIAQQNMGQPARVLRFESSAQTSGAVVGTPFRLTHRAVAPDARCIVCGELLRDCGEEHA